MIRKSVAGGSAQGSGSCHGKFFCRVSVRQLLGVAIFLAGWSLVMADLLDGAPGPATTPLVQQMIWNPSPK